MEFSTRMLLCSPNLTRHLRTSAVFLKRQQQPSLNSIPNKHPPFLIPPSTVPSSSPIPFLGIRASHSGSFSHRVSGQFGLFSSLSSSQITTGSNGSVSPDVDHHQNDKFSDSNFPSSKGIHGGGDVAAGDKVPLVTAVLLGWLGAEPKHLKRYADLYNSRGINSVNFVVSAREAVSFDNGKKLEGRIESLSFEIESWLRDSGKDGRERFLIFHTFSNTGWLVYGSILDKFQGKKEVLEKIKGCVVDSGPDPGINPKVWAAGFGTAILKKRGSAVYPPKNATSKIDTGTDTDILEIMLLALLEKVFNVLLHLPYINQRLKKIIGILTNNQPNCPQLYLYSTADKVIPYQSVESFIEDQKRKGREVLSFNFGASPHVDHYRNFPDIYSSQLYQFMEMSLPRTSYH